MCHGGPNHCRVGWAGGQSYLAVSFTFVMVASCWSSSGDVESHVLLLLHARTHLKKKKKKKNCTYILEWLS
jgi:hypothetical protein